MSEILAINSGSPSLNFAVFGVPDGGRLPELMPTYRGHFSGLGRHQRLIESYRTLHAHRAAGARLRSPD